jgi:hypothetical protein
VLATGRRVIVDTSVDPAVRRAREVVGLYGDPSVTWGICVDLAFSAPIDLAGLPRRLAELGKTFPHLGRPPSTLRVGQGQWAASVQAVAADPYGDHAPLVRILLAEDGRRLAVGAHHGVCDGLGLLAVAEAVTGAAISSAARGIGDRTGRRPFLVSSALRLGEALFAPPARFRGTREAGAAGEHLMLRELPALRAGTAAVAHAIGEAFASWRTGRRVSGRRPVLVVGASRRTSAKLAPDRQTAYFRLPFDPDWTQAEFSGRLERLEPEPVFPETSAGGVGPRVTRALRGRLGATAIVSNLGRLDGRGLVGAAMYPAASGPFSVAFGFASTASASTLTLRTRSADFSRAETELLLDEVGARLARAGAQ